VFRLCHVGFHWLLDCALSQRVHHLSVRDETVSLKHQSNKLHLPTVRLERCVEEAVDELFPGEFAVSVGVLTTEDVQHTRLVLPQPEVESFSPVIKVELLLCLSPQNVFESLL